MSKNKLTAKQELFVKHYPSTKNATKAALLAGYSEKTAYSIGHDLLKKPEIAEAINKVQKKAADKAEITYEWKVAMLKKTIEGCAHGEATKDGYIHPSGIVSAIAELNKMQGHYAPEKTMNKTMIAASDDAGEWDKMADEYSKDLSKFDKDW